MRMKSKGIMREGILEDKDVQHADLGFTEVRLFVCVCVCDSMYVCTLQMCDL